MTERLPELLVVIAVVCFGAGVVAALVINWLERRDRARATVVGELERCQRCGGERIQHGAGYVYRIAWCTSCGALYQREQGEPWRQAPAHAPEPEPWREGFTKNYDPSGDGQ